MTHAPRGLQPGDRRPADAAAAAGGPLASKKRQSILVGDYNSAPGNNANDRGTTRADNAYDSAIKAGFRNNLPKRKTCCFARGPAQHRRSRWRRGSTTCSCGPNIRVLKSGIVGTKQVGGLYPSDHAGITATLRLK